MTTREEKTRRKLLQEEAVSPGKCHCRDVPRSSSDEVTGYTEPVYSFYDHLEQGPTHRYPIRTCGVCGKEYVDAPVIA